MLACFNRSIDVTSGDDEKFAQYGQLLNAAVCEAVRPWLVRELTIRVGEIDGELAERIEGTALEVERSIAELVAADVDEPLSGPLERIRVATQPLNDELERRGVAPPARNPVDQQMRPLDRYELGPMTFRDLSEAMHEAGITWGAAKAHLHLARHRAPGIPPNTPTGDSSA